MDAPAVVMRVNRRLSNSAVASCGAQCSMIPALLFAEQIALFEPLVANVQQTVEERTGTPFHDNECAEHGRGSCVDGIFGVFAADGEHQLLQVHCDEAIRVRPSFLDDAEFITGR